jgi:hypothetical protein
MESSPCARDLPIFDLILIYKSHQVLISTPVQLFIAWRIRVVTRSYVLPGFIALLAIISFGALSLYLYNLYSLLTRDDCPGGGLATSLIVSLFPASEKITKFRTEIIIWLVSSTVCDVVLTVSLVASLVRPDSGVHGLTFISELIGVQVDTQNEHDLDG